MQAEAIISSTWPHPGLHPGVSDAEYFALEAASASRLSDFAQSAAHCRHRIDNPEDPTPDMRLGSAAHCLILQPDQFDTRYVVAGRCSARLKSERPCGNDGKYLVGGDWLCGVHAKANRHCDVFEAVTDRLVSEGCKLARSSNFGSLYFERPDGKIVRVSDHAPNTRGEGQIVRGEMLSVRVDLPPHGMDDPRAVLAGDDWGRCRRMRDAVMVHPMAAMLLSAPGPAEVPFVWDCPRSGVRCKGKADKLAQFDDFNELADLKTTANASPSAFRKTVGEYGYHRQGAHYLNGLAQNGVFCESFRLIAVEKSPPFGVCVFRVIDSDIEKGNGWLRRQLEGLRRCQESGVWPSYPIESQDLSIPSWVED